ncbi:hypothetical protein AgCh_035646 [Apium graveolens]
MSVDTVMMECTPLSTPTVYLAGPPEMNKSSSSSSSVKNPALDSFNLLTPPHRKGYTIGHSLTYITTSNPCLDFYVHVVPSTPKQTLITHLQSAWSSDPLTTLKLICNLRGVLGTGKGNKEAYYTAVLWLHSFHPKTLVVNLEVMADFGYFKDLPEILHRLLKGHSYNVHDPYRSYNVHDPYRSYNNYDESSSGHVKRPFSLDTDKRNEIGNVASRRRSREARLLAEKKKVEDEIKKAKQHREENKVVKSAKAVTSLAAKWCPSLDKSLDRSTLLCESIARKIFPKQLYPEYEGVEDAHYAYRVRDRLRKEVLVPLRKALQLPEVYMGANKWDSIRYNRVASVAMTNYKNLFLKHDRLRFDKYLEKVKSGKATIASGALLPHKIIESLNDDDLGTLAELQWNGMVDDLSSKGKLKNCIAEPWNGKLITFSTNPKLQKVEGEDLRAKVDFVRHLEVESNTDFQKVFDVILKVAEMEKLNHDQMIKKVFVFSDMEFDAISENIWETDYQAITRKYAEKGYGSCVPEIVFWQLTDSKVTPVSRDKPGVALVSGYSKNLMILFLEDKGPMTPETVMEAAIGGEEYSKLVVVD